MSKTIDERVVELRLDNATFERNASQSMSTVEKLKQKLHFKESSKAFDNIGSAAKKANLNALSSSVENLRLKFSALDVVGVTALTKISSAAITAGKNLVKSFTIDPIMTGLQEYETQLNSVQTILANTQSKGTTLTQVNSALAELNKYADQTIYNFSEMTKNIGTFTAAGVGLETSVASIKGIANLAALSGSSASQASTAMYQLSQAIASGKVQLQDWNSVVNAGMGGEVFQNALKRTAEHFGTNVDGMIQKYGSFRESLTKGQWLTTDVLTETLKQLSGAYTEADLIAQGYTEAQARDIVQLAETAKSAATDVKTFTQLMDTAKEAVGSGWAQTWQLIIGDFEQAKTTFSAISKVVNGVIEDVSNARNAFLFDALGSNWEKLEKQITDAGVKVEDFNTALEQTARNNGVNVEAMVEQYGSLANAFQEGAISSDIIVEAIKSLAGVTKETAGSTEDMTSKLQHFQEVVDKVWNGSYGAGEERIRALTEAGYDYAKVQDLVNKSVDGHRLTLEDLGEEQLKAIGYTDQEISKLQELAAQAEQTGTPINDLIENITKPSGRELLWDSIITGLQSIVDVARAVGDAFQDAFGDNITSSGLYNMIAGINQLTHAIAPTEEQLRKITSTFKGLFAIIDIVTTITGGGLKLAFKALGQILGGIDIDILDVTAAVGEAIASFRDWLFEGNRLMEGLTKIGQVIGDAFRELANTPFVQNLIQNIQNGLQGLREVGSNVIEGLKNGLMEGLSSIPQILVQIGQAIVNAIKGVLGIHSPSTVMEGVGRDTIQGLLNGLKEGASKVIEFFRELGQKIVDIASNIDFGQVVAVGVFAGMGYIAKRTLDIVEKIVSPLDGLKGVFDSVKKTIDDANVNIQKILKSIAGYVKAAAFKTAAAGIKDLALSIGILAASITVLSNIDTGSLIKGGIALGVIAIGLGALTAFSAKMAKGGGKFGTLNLMGLSSSLMTLSLSLAFMGKAMKTFESLDAGKFKQTLTGFSAAVVTLVGSMAVFGQLSKGSNWKSIASIGPTMLLLSVSFKLIASTVKTIGELDETAIDRAQQAILGFGAMIMVLGKISPMFKGNLKGLGSTMIQLTVALGLMVGVVKLINMLTPGEMAKGAVAIAGFGIIVTALANIMTTYNGSNLKGLSSVLLSMSVSIGLLAGVAKLVGTMEVGEMVKGGAAVAALVLMMRTLVNGLKGFQSEAPKIAGTILAMSVGIGILAGVSALLGMINTKDLAKGIIAVGFLSAFMAGLVAVTHLAQSVKGELIAITVAVGVMAAAVVALSFIEPGKLAGATAALGILMGMFALIMAATPTVKGAALNLGVMAGVIVVLGIVIANIAALPVQNALAASASLSILLVAMAASFALIAGAGTVALGAIAGLAAMTLIVAGLSLVIAQLANINPQNVLPNVLSLSILLAAMTAACVALGFLQPTALVGVAALAVVTLLVAGLTAIIAKLAEIDASKATPNVKNLVVLLTALTAVTAVLTVVGAAAPAAIAGALAFDGVILAIGGLMAGLGALVSYIPQLETFLDRGITVLQKVGQGIGNFIGGIIGGVMEGAASTLPSVADSLSDFMVRLTPFIVGAQMIDDGMVNGVKKLAETILILTGAGIVDSIGKFVGATSIPEFAAQLQPLGEGIASFAQSVSGVDAGAVEASANAAKVLAEMASSIPNEGGFIAKLTGDNSLISFAQQLVPFGVSLSAYSMAVKNVDEAAVTGSANAAQALTNMAQSIPNTGGLIAKFTGDNSLATFAQQLVPFGDSLALYSNTVKNVDEAAVTGSANAAQALVSLAQAIPNTGGLAAAFAGDNSLATFGVQIVAFGTSMSLYSQAVSGVQPEVVEKSIAAGQALASLQNSLGNTGGLASIFAGDNSLASFGSQIVAFGESMSEYSEAVAGVNPDIVSKTASAAQALVSLQNALPDNGAFTNETWLDEFGAMLPSFGEDLASFYDSVSGIDAGAVSGVVTAVRQLKTLISSLSGLDTSGVSGFKQAIDELGKVSIDKLVSAFQGASGKISSSVTNMFQGAITAINTAKSSITNAMNSMVDGMVQAITAKQGAVTAAMNQLVNGMVRTVQSRATAVNSAFIAMMNNAVSTIRAQYGRFVAVGSYIVQGLANGIRAGTPSAVAAARSMASAVQAAAKVDLGVHSPSTKFYQIGGFVAQGLANGLRGNSYIAENASRTMARGLITAMQKTLKIQSPSVVAKDEVGRYIVQGIAEGITQDMSAEEAAAKKAENIVNAFKESLDKIDMTMGTMDLEEKLLGLTYGDESEENKTGNKLMDYKRTLMFIDKIKLAQGEYNALVKEFGKDNDKSKEAYDKFLQSQIDFAEFIKDTPGIMSNLPLQNYLKELQTGDAALIFKDLEQIMNESISAINPPAMAQRALEAGEQVPRGMAAGVQQQAPVAVASTTQLSNDTIKPVNDSKPKWQEAGVAVVNGFVDGMSSQIEAAATKAAEIAKAAYAAAMAAIPDAASSAKSSSSSGGRGGGGGGSSKKPVGTWYSSNDPSTGYKPIFKPNKGSNSSTANKVSAATNKGSRTPTRVGDSRPNINNYTFNQTNNSPKALSSREIYRQTKNQFSALKGAVNSK